MKKGLKVLLGIVLAVLILVVGYLAYVLIDYHRIGDMELEISNNQNGKVQIFKPYKIVSYNIGFGAYESDYDFFMDGGTQSWAWSEERLKTNMDNIANTALDQKADFYLMQEVDANSTRSYHVDEAEILRSAIENKASIWAQNYDSPFLFYPFTQPHGASKSGIMTFSPFEITSAIRHELPIENSLMKLVDLDRCYSVSRIPVETGRELVLYNVHLSAYTSDGTVVNEQLRLLLEDMQNEYNNGNYVVCGGDFNKDLLGDSSKYFGKADKEYTWAQPIPDGTFDGSNFQLIAPLDKDNPVASSRNADAAYHEGQFVVTLDGFIVSDNVAVGQAKVIDTGFAYSDHNPVQMVFTLK